eukprot:Nitzschia sp. Nitz4//scaffold5_size260463//232448//233212//NITZ4_001025-RA/size260463-augustus-gene-0.111-mRNA-1//-1//CDS//3329555469//7019//frame0
MIRGNISFTFVCIAFLVWTTLAEGWRFPWSTGKFHIVDESVAYRGWRTIVKRQVRMRNGNTVTFDLVGVKTGGSAVMMFAWDTKTKTATLIREYMPGPHKVMWGLAAGMVEEKHGNQAEKAARDELEEEAHLEGGTWIRLTPRKGPGIGMDKYSLTNVHAFLVLDAQPAMNPKSLDDEEDIEYVRGVPIAKIMEWIAKGEMNMVSAWGCLLAIEKLRELGEYP